MMKSAEDAISKIPFVKCEGRQNLDFAVWKKSFATSMGQRYGELLEVNRTAEVFTHTALIELDAAVVDGKKNQMHGKSYVHGSDGRTQEGQAAKTIFGALH